MGIEDTAHEFAARHRVDAFGQLLVLIVLSLFAVAIVDARSAWSLIPLGLLMATLLLAMRASKASSRLRKAATIGSAGALLLVAAARTMNEPRIASVAYLLVAATLAGLAPIAIARRLLKHKQVTGRTVAGALCIYLLVGLLFATVYATLGIVSGPFFQGNADPPLSDYVYFSFVTLTTVGYGDLTAAGQFGKMLTVVEGLVGQLYLVTVVAVLVSNIGRERNSLEDEIGDAD